MHGDEKIGPLVENCQTYRTALKKMNIPLLKVVHVANDTPLTSTDRMLTKEGNVWNHFVSEHSENTKLENTYHAYT